MAEMLDSGPGHTMIITPPHYNQRDQIHSKLTNQDQTPSKFAKLITFFIDSLVSHGTDSASILLKRIWGRLVVVVVGGRGGGGGEGGVASLTLHASVGCKQEI